VDGPLLGISAGATGLTILAGRNLDPLTQAEIDALDPANLSDFDRPAIDNYSTRLSDFSDILVGTLILLPAGLLTSEKIRNDALTVGVIYAEVVVLANLGPELFKVLTPRVRPYVYNSSVPPSEKTTVYAKESFFSGHTSNAFASAIFLSSVYSAYYPDSRWSPYIWGGSLGLAALVGYLRFESGKHFPTDVLTGAAWGSAIGFLVPYFHRTNNNPAMGWNPVIGNKLIGGQITFAF
jgi:membrane-associated phospholipid phosphatase